MLRFVATERETPEKRPAPERGADFGEIFASFAAAKAAEQASRCAQCGVPFCQVHCPLSNHIPDWLKLTAEGRLEEAYELSQATNAMPEVCGRICPQDRLCEGSCVIEQSGHGTVTIGAIEKYITDTAWERGWVKPLVPRCDRPESVGIVGAGPAGLTAAENLREQGYRVTVYDRHDRAGGLLTYGIPNFKLDKAVVMRRVDRLAAGGIAFRMNCDVGRDITFTELRRRHNAVLLATGTYRARELEAPGVGLANVVPALDYLMTSNRRGFGDGPANADSLDAHGKNVVVIGGGDTAMDCVRTAVRQGAKSVSCLYRRDRENMPGSRREVGYAEEEGVRFIWLVAPKALIGPDAVRTVRGVRMRLGAPDASQRRGAEEIAGSDFSMDADLVIKALGFEAEDLRATMALPDIALTRNGTLRISYRTMMTNLDGVFAAGDIVRGASLVVWAIRDGREAAAAMHQYIQSTAEASRVAAE